ncbi:hypothetical protein [Streptomyces sp. NPDC056296]|uniref:hypothetical protein n=1 Tax=Streptomyces sp. NPDC056296 TaxID=3345775 RepID=UPI0035DE24E1
MSPEGLTNEPTMTVAQCIKCHTLTNAPVAVRWARSDSGPGTTLWACPTHAPELSPGPMPGELESGAQA